MRWVTVQRVEDDGDRALVFGEAADGSKVSFHLPAESGREMRDLLSRGEVVMADLPEPGPAPLRVTSHQVSERRRGRPS